jgi:peptidoglycan-associated lipoprotein
MMKRLLTIVWVILGIFVITGCTQRKIASPPEQPLIQEKADADRMKQDGRESLPGETGTARDLQRDGIGERQLQTDQREGLQEAPEEIQKRVKDIFFDYDKYDIREDAKPGLKELASLLSKNMSLKVVIEGHCDDRGTNEYNLALGDRRAQAAKQFLVSLGIPSARIETVSYGEEKPLCTTASEDCWAKNRRAHFVILKEGR